jgi:hypothetical protein
LGQRVASKSFTQPAFLRALLTELDCTGPLRKGVRVKVGAAWDTVGSLGFPMPGIIPQQAAKKLGVVNSIYPKSIEVAV